MKIWTGRVPLKDDFDAKIIDEFIDGRTIYGSWAYMTPASWKAFGCGQLGIGCGQRYVRQGARWVKANG
jgi:hypothetical protein